jgi:hypothetical protein
VTNCSTTLSYRVTKGTTCIHIIAWILSLTQPIYSPLVVLRQILTLVIELLNEVNSSVYLWQFCNWLRNLDTSYHLYLKLRRAVPVCLWIFSLIIYAQEICSTKNPKSRNYWH